MAINAFKCGSCGKMTKHVEVSGRECAASHYSSDSWSDQLSRACATVSDISGMTNMVHKQILGIRFYKCTECGRIDARKANGEIEYGY